MNGWGETPNAFVFPRQRAIQNSTGKIQKYGLQRSVVRSLSLSIFVPASSILLLTSGGKRICILCRGLRRRRCWSVAAIIRKAGKGSAKSELPTLAELVHLMSEALLPLLFPSDLLSTAFRPKNASAMDLPADPKRNSNNA
jgi:hypothetical protein